MTSHNPGAIQKPIWATSLDKRYCYYPGNSQWLRNPGPGTRDRDLSIYVWICFLWFRITQFKTFCLSAPCLAEVWLKVHITEAGAERYPHWVVVPWRSLASLGSDQVQALPSHAVLYNKGQGPLALATLKYPSNCSDHYCSQRESKIAPEFWNYPKCWAGLLHWVMQGWGGIK